MIATCPKCGNYEWDKEVKGNKICCPKCGAEWEFKKLPLYVLSGCSGIGKTTTAICLQKMTSDFVVLDGDMFYNIMPHETEADFYAQVEQIGSLSKNINQCGKPVVWAMAGNLDKLPNTYNSRFFSEIKVLALVCDEQSLRARMTEGRQITDEGWINGSVQYNQYFRTHDKIGETAFDTLDTQNRSVEEVAADVLRWLERNA